MGGTGSGRRPLPTKIKELTGNRGRRPLNDREPRPAVAIPLPPAELGKSARTEWARVCGELYDLGIISSIDRAVVVAYCHAWETFQTAMAEVKKPPSKGGGLVITTKNGNIIQNPMLSIANTARKDMVRFAAELGMSPASRSRVKVDELPRFGVPKGDEEEESNERSGGDEFLDE